MISISVFIALIAAASFFVVDEPAEFSTKKIQRKAGNSSKKKDPTLSRVFLHVN
ncbi:hypothetical protein [Gangjinia marincola]|uniref:hypothetical protein n=1 Tax=Gangjinia marincola TaxID=578463 RepID=UPI0031E0F702